MKTSEIVAAMQLTRDIFICNKLRTALVDMHLLPKGAVGHLASWKGLPEQGKAILQEVWKYRTDELDKEIEFAFSNSSGWFDDPCRNVRTRIEVLEKVKAHFEAQDD